MLEVPLPVQHPGRLWDLPYGHSPLLAQISVRRPAMRHRHGTRVLPGILEEIAPNFFQQVTTLRVMEFGERLDVRAVHDFVVFFVPT
jgi:hypothetical protein